jgi:hypothetical protein
VTAGPFVKVLVLVGSTIVLGVLYELAFREREAEWKAKRPSSEGHQHGDYWCGGKKRGGDGGQHLSDSGYLGWFRFGSTATQVLSSCGGVGGVQPESRRC